jgi:prophage regulatory protein
MMKRQKISRLPDVIGQTGLSRSTLYELIRRGDFPRQIRLGPRAVGWVDSDIDDWIRRRIEISNPPDAR